MPTRLDHLVILVRDLEGAIEDYGRLGFRVTPGGEHADGLTRNALVPLRDGAYLELVVFVDPESDRDNVWGWRGFLPGEGLIDYCAASEDLRGEERGCGGSGSGWRTWARAAGGCPTGRRSGGAAPASARRGGPCRS